MRVKKLALILLVFVLLAAAAPAVAQEGGEDEILPCEGESVSGTVVDVDEATGVVTVETETGLCTVTLDAGEYEHPIVGLLGTFFGDVNVGDLAEALDTVQGCVLEEDGTWTWVDCETEGAQEATVTLYDEGTGTFTGMVGDEEVTIVVGDETVAEELGAALQALAIEWNLGEGGTLIQPGDDIAAYHDAGMGFGVLVKLYGMAAAAGVPVEDLVLAFQGGRGLGQLFKDYGRPAILGVGHVRGRGNGHAYGRPEHAGPKEGHGPPDHAGPKEGHGRPEHAGPKN